MSDNNVDLANSLKFVEISQNAFSLINNMSIKVLNRNKYGSILISLLYIMENTSQAIRLLVENSLIIPAVALARIRLEQASVYSYLIHSDESIGLQPFMSHIPISEYIKSALAMTEPSVVKNMKDFDIESLKEVATAIQSKITPNFTGDKFEKKWTKLDLLSMVKARDNITKDLGDILGYRLEIDYVTLYKEASSLIHFDGNSIFSYTNYFVTKDDEQLIIGTKSSWAPMVAAFNAHYDIINVLEFASVMNINIDDDIGKLYDQYKAYILSAFLENSKKADDIT